MNNLIWLLLLLLLLALAAIVSTFLFLGVGYILFIILPLSLFESAVLAIGSSFVLAFSIAAVSIGMQFSRHGFFLPRNNLHPVFDEDDEDDFDEEYEGEEYEEHKSENVLDPQRVAGNAIKIGRNTPCPCGSGLKYKRCCGR
jgi:energy-coupling factor transporter transmembrane protein EcfT